MPLMGEFMRRYPDAVPDLYFDNRQVDLIVERFNVAIGIGIGIGIELTDALIARELARRRVVLVAVPAYLEDHPVPTQPQDLARHRGLLRRLLSSGRLPPWIIRNDAGEETVASMRVEAVLPGATATDFWSLAGTPIERLPQEIVMRADAMVDAALIGLDQRELVTIPALEDDAKFDAWGAARRAMHSELSTSTPASRYRLPKLA